MKRTIVIEARVDALSLALITKYYKSKGLAPLSKSELVRSIITDFARIIEEQGLVPSSSTLEDALNYLQENFGNMNRGGRGRGTLLRELRLESIGQVEGEGESMVEKAQAILDKMEGGKG